MYKRQINIVPPPLPFSFSLFLFSVFFFLSSFFSSFLSFCVFSFLLPFPFILSFCLFFCLFLQDHILRFFLALPCFLWRILLFCDLVSALHPPPARLASLKFAYSPCLRSCVDDVDLFCFISSSLPSLLRFRFGHRFFHPVLFLWVLCCLLGFGFGGDSLTI